MIDHISISQIDMFFRCGEQYRRRYIEGERVPPGIALHIGTGVHKAAEHNYRQKILTGEDLPAAQLQEVAVDAYAKSLDKQGVMFTAEERPAAKKILGESADVVSGLTVVLREKVTPEIQPALIEESMTLDVPGLDVPFLGIVDCYSRDGRLSDLKTAAKKWSQDKADSESQPTLYRKLIKARTGSYPLKITFDVLTKTKTPAHQQLVTERDDDDFAILVRKAKIMLRMVSAGIFAPAEPGSWSCSAVYCGFWASCPLISPRLKRRPNVEVR
jgi:hypothetical protein